MLFIVGLTGVGKSTTLAGLLRQRPELRLLPNRRALADTIIIPWVQAQEGQPERPISDRVTRFAYTKRYRDAHPGGMVDALEAYLKAHPDTLSYPLVFDNLRGKDEVNAALKRFAQSRFVVLDAPIMVRLERLLGREDRFDGLAPPAPPSDTGELTSQLEGIEGLDTNVECAQLQALMRRTGASLEAMTGAVKIVLAEQQNYHAEAALTRLQSALGPERLLHIDTSQQPPAKVIRRINGWLS